MDETMSNIINLHAKRIEYGECKHKPILVDPYLKYVECRDCGEKLDPMQILYRFATEEKYMHRKLSEDRALISLTRKKLNKKRHTKCDHCGRMTPVNINITHGEILEKSRDFNK